MKVSTILASRFSDPQLDEFEEILAQTDEADIANVRIAWLKKNYPTYSNVVRYQK